jgi:hypothetical protein
MELICKQIYPSPIRLTNLPTEKKHQLVSYHVLLDLQLKSFQRVINTKIQHVFFASLTSINEMTSLMTTESIQRFAYFLLFSFIRFYLC